MAYFNELPNVEVVSRFPNQSSNQDYTTIKNLWRRPKLREDIANAITAFNYYQIEGDERPDQIAKKIYGDSELDWVVLITNNITNLNEDWPLDNNSFYNYLIDKYGSEEAFQEIHHSETLEQKDNYNRLVIPGGLVVDPTLNLPTSFTTESGKDSYRLNSFPSADALTAVKVNLIQILKIKLRDSKELLNPISDIRIETSKIKVKTRDDKILDIRINNNLEDFWPSSWGGKLPVYMRNEVNNIIIDDMIDTDFSINIPERLYEVTGTLINGKIVPIFQFRYVATG